MANLSSEMKKTEESKEEKTQKEEGSFEDELIRSLLSGVKMAVKGQVSDESSEIIKADSLEVSESFKLEVPAEEFGSLDELFQRKISGLIDALTSTITSSQEEFKDSVKKKKT